MSLYFITQIEFMSECMCIDFDLFMACKSSKTIEGKISNKIEHILKEYTCFKENSAPPFIYKETFHKSFKNIGKKRDEKVKKPAHHHNTSCDQKDVLALLNKLSSSNFDLLYRKLLFMCSSDNISIVVRLIIDKCYTQYAYSHLFINILKNLMNVYKECVANNIKCFYDEWRMNFKENLKNIAELAKDNNYDVFCSFVSNKNMCTQKHSIIIEFIKNKLYIDNINTHIAFIIEVLNEYSTVNEVLDVIILCILDILSRFKLDQETIEVLLSNLIPLEDNCCNKVRFKIKDTIVLLKNL